MRLAKKKNGGYRALIVLSSKVAVKNLKTND
jgi:hypothetical protein